MVVGYSAAMPPANPVFLEISGVFLEFQKIISEEGV
jgi:hypothetical protein